MEATKEWSGWRASMARLTTSLRVARALPLIALALTALALAQQYFGLGLTRTFTIDTKRLQFEDKRFRIKLPEDYRNDMPSDRARLFENGRPFVNRTDHVSDLPRLGPGVYNVHAGILRFSPLDGSDPRSNGRLYTIRVPLQFEPELWWYLGGLLLLTLGWQQVVQRRTAFEPAAFAASPSISWWRHPAAQAGGVFAFAFLTLAAQLWIEPDLTDGALIVKGMPESDAAGWHDMAIGLADGRGFTTVFESQRPLHAVLLAFAYWLVGPQVMVGQFFQMAGLALAAVGMWLAGVLIGRWWAGLAAVLVLVVGETHAVMAHLIMTENSGVVFGVFAFLGAVAGAWLLSPRWSFAGGVLCGLGNLASGALLLTAPLYAVLMLLNPLLRRAPWQRAVLLAACFTVGVSIVMVPWMLRQKKAHGHFTVSYSTADLLYGSADPKSGRITIDDFKEAERLGYSFDNPGSRYDYFMTKFKQLVAADPLGYLRRLALASWNSFVHMRLTDPGWRVSLMLMILVAGTLQAWRGGGVATFLATAAIVYGLGVLTEEKVAPVTAAAWFIAWRRARHPLERLCLYFLGATIVAMALVGGLSGNVVSKRLWTVADWAVVITLVVGSERAVEAVASVWRMLTARVRLLHPLVGAPPSSRTPTGDLTPLMPGLVTGSALLVVAALASISVTGMATLRGPRPVFDSFASIDPAKLASDVVAAHSNPLSGKPIESRLVMLDDIVIPLKANEDIGHWLPVYARRPYDRLVLSLVGLNPSAKRSGRLIASFKGSADRVPKRTPLLWIGIRSSGINRLKARPESVMETIALVPLLRTANGDWQIDASHAVWSAPTPEIEAASK